MDEEPLPLSTYATILAHLVSRRGEPFERVLSDLGVSEETFARAEAHFNERLRESLRHRKGILAMTFAEAFAEARKAKGLFSHTGSIVIGPAAPAPEPTALPSYMNAPPPGQAAYSPAASPQPAAPPVVVAAPPVVVAAPPAVVTAPPAVVTAPPAAQASSGVGTGTLPAAAEAPRLPDTPWDQVKRTVGKLTLAHYAALTIELGRNPPDLTPILARYGLSTADDLRHVTAAFQTQMQFDPALKAQFDALIGRMRSMSRRDG